MTPTQELILPIVTQSPGLTASAIAKRLGMDRNNIRKAALDLADAGGLRKEINGQGYAFFPVNGGGTKPEVYPLSGHVRPRATGQKPINGEPVQSPSTGGAMVVHPMHETPVFGGRGRARSHPGGIMASMPGMFQADGGDGEWLVNQWTQRAAGAVSNENALLRDENQRLRQAVVVAKPREPTWQEMLPYALGSTIKTIGVLAANGERPAAKRARKQPDDDEPDDEPMIDRFTLKRQAEDAARAEYEVKARRLIRQTLRQELDGDDEQMDLNDNTETAPTASKLQQLLSSKPNGNTEPEPVKQPMPLGVKWSIAAGCVGAFVLAVVKFGGRLSA